MMHYIRQVLDFTRRPRLQLAIVVAAFFYLAFFMYWQARQIHFADQVQQVSQVQDKVRQLSSQVNVGLHINNFPEFSFLKNKFILDALVWFTYPVGTESLHTIEQFSFQNGKLLRRSLPTIKIVDETVMVSFQVLVEFKAHLNYTYFPISDHRLNIVLENRRVTPNEMCLNGHVGSFQLSDDMFTSTWQPRKKIVASGYIKSTLHRDESDLSIDYPCVAFMLEFTNSSARNLISLYFPLFILFFIGLFSLLIDVNDSSLRTTLIAGSLPTLVLFRLVIDNMGPQQASDITRVDYLYYTLVLLAIIILLFQVYVLLVQRRLKESTEKEKKRRIRSLELTNSAIFLGIIITLLVTFTVTHSI